MTLLDEILEEVNALSRRGAYFICIHLETNLIIGPFPESKLDFAEDFIKHLLTKWPDLEAHVVKGSGIGRRS